MSTPVTTESRKAETHAVSELRAELRENIRMSLIFAALCGIAYGVFSLKAVALLLAIPLGVFVIKAAIAGAAIFHRRHRGEGRVPGSIFEQRISEMDEDESLDERELFGHTIRVIRDSKRKAVDLDRIIGTGGDFLATFEAYKKQCREAHPELGGEIDTLTIVGLEPDDESTVFLYFDGLPGRLFMARYDGSWFTI